MKLSNRDGRPVEKSDLKTFLLNDFIREFPTSTRAERVELYTRLDGLSFDELRLLVEQVEAQNEATNQTDK